MRQHSLEVRTHASITKCNIKRLLGCIEYGFEPKHESLCYNHEYCFVFEIDQQSTLIVKQTIPKIEPHIYFFWVHLAKLDSIDLRPEPLKEFLPLWLASTENNTFQSMMVCYGWKCKSGRKPSQRCSSAGPLFNYQRMMSKILNSFFSFQCTNKFRTSRLRI